MFKALCRNMTLFAEAFHTSESILKIYHSWLLQEITPLKVTLMFNYLYVQLVMIDVTGRVRRYKVSYTQPRWKVWWYLCRFAYLFWSDIIHARELRYEKLYVANLGVRTARYT